MSAAVRHRPLIRALPAVRGKLIEGQVLASLTWFRVGGPADVLFLPADTADLAQFLAQTPPDVPVSVIGVASNLLVRDGGVRGVVVRLGAGFAAVSVAGDGIVSAGAAALDVAVARAARDGGLGGLEFLAGIPGTIGGALAMNAGAYGREIKDVLDRAEALDRTGLTRCLGTADMGFRYRGSVAGEGLIFTRAWLRGLPRAVAEIDARMAEVTQAREKSQPVRARTGGSTFKNPPADVAGGRRAWELIDAAGCRGLVRGDAQVSEQHCNFLINRGRARAADLEALGESVRERVLKETGVMLEWEIKRVGEEA